MTTAPALIDASPRRAPALRVGPAVLRGERVVHLVKDTRSGKFFELGVKEEFVVARLDGATTLREIGEQYAATFGRALDDAAWGQILGALHRRSFLDVPQARAVPPVDEPEQPRNWRLATASWGDPSRVLDRWEPRLRWLFHPAAAVLVALVCLGLLGYLVANLGTMRHELPVLWHHPELAVLAFMLIWVSSALHEFAHGLVCHHYGGRATDIGVRWRAPMVVFYCEADDVLVLRTKRGQVLTAAAGVVANLVFLLPFFVLYLVLPRGEVTHDALAGLLVFGALRALVNYLPLPELDGYQMLQHGWAVTGLAKQTWRYVRGDRSAYPARAKRIYPLYAVLFVLSWCAVLAAAVAVLVTATSGVARVVVLAVFAAWLVLTVAVSVLRRRRPRAPAPPPDPSPPPAERDEPPMPVQPETTPETRATTQAAPVLVVEDLHKTYGDVVAVAGTSLTVHEGEFFGILGPNGAGKTTLIEIMEGQRTPDSGTVTVFGSSPWPRSVEVNRRIGVQTQASSFFPQLTALEHLETVAGLYDLDRSAAAGALADVGLSESAKVLVTKLSGGQRQRLAIASALVHKPDLLFLDEPTAALDPKSRRDLWGLLRDISERGCSIVYTTHHLDEAEALCDRVAIIRDGDVIALDSPRELIRGAGAKSKVVVPGALLDVDTARAMDGVDSARAAGGDVEITTAAVSKVLAALGSTVDLGEVETRRPTLEDVYLDLTGAEYQP